MQELTSVLEQSIPGWLVCTHNCLNTENKPLTYWFHHNKYHILLHSFDSREDKSMKRRMSWEPLDHEVSTSAALPLYQQLLHLFHYNHKVRQDLLHRCTLPLLTRTTHKLVFLKLSWFCFLEDKTYVNKALDTQRPQCPSQRPWIPLTMWQHLHSLAKLWALLPHAPALQKAAGRSSRQRSQNAKKGNYFFMTAGKRQVWGKSPGPQSRSLTSNIWLSSLKDY